MSQSRNSLAGQLVVTAVSIVLIAVAVRFAVNLILSIWVPLVVIVGIGLVVYGAIAWRRRRTRSW